jgi:hypothetical protein
MSSQVIHLDQWSSLPRAGTGLDAFVDGILTSLDGRVIRADDPEVRSRLLSFLNAKPIGFVVGPVDQLARADREFCDGDHELVFVETADQARKELSTQPEGREIAGMYLVKPSQAHLRQF